jgi:hypothetical protein
LHGLALSLFPFPGLPHHFTKIVLIKHPFIENETRGDTRRCSLNKHNGRSFLEALRRSRTLFWNINVGSSACPQLHLHRLVPVILSLPPQSGHEYFESTTSK